MNSFEIIIMGAALAMDAFAVSIACGLQKEKSTNRNALKVAIFFGFFQALMPTIGYFTGINIPLDVSSFDHWIAFILLAGIGIHMIKESFGDECDEDTKDLFKTTVLLISAIATSIDALATGFTISLLNADINLLVISAGVITAVMSFIGVKIGKRLGHLIESRAELISGLVLILIGIRILIDHLTA